MIQYDTVLNCTMYSIQYVEYCMLEYCIYIIKIQFLK